MSKTSVEFLAYLEEKIERNKEYADKIFEDMTEEEFNRQALPGKWSSGQALEHLNITNGKYLEAIEKVLEDPNAKKAAATKKYKHGWFMNKFISMAGPTTKMKFKVPNKVVIPPKELNMQETVKDYGNLNAKLKEAVTRAKGLDLRKNSLKSPLVGWLKLSLGEAFHLLTDHDTRHLQQAQRSVEVIRRKW